LYFQGEKIATLWDNDKHTIPIERPGTYSLQLRHVNGAVRTTSVVITSRGITKVDFSTIYGVGVTSPSGGIVFYDKGDNSNGWRYLEAAPADTEFSSNWNDAINRCRTLNVNGTTGWWLPNKAELELMYRNLKQKGLGGFSKDVYWSSSQWSDRSYAYGWAFIRGGEIFDSPSQLNSVRAVRSF